MAVATSFLLKWSVNALKRADRLSLALLLYGFIMMLAMDASAVIYFLSPSMGTLIILVVVNMIVMGLGLVPAVAVFFDSLKAAGGAEPKATGQGDSGEPGARARGQLWNGFRPLVLALVLLNEFLMGWAFLAASGASVLAISQSTLLGVFGSVIGSYWFIFTMSLEMMLTTFLLRHELDRVFLVVLASQSVIMFLSPTAIPGQAWTEVAVFGGGSAMILLFIFVFEHLARNRTISPGLSHYIPQLFLAYAAMMVGVLTWEIYGDVTVFALSLLIDMAIYLGLILRTKPLQGEATWMTNARWTVSLLSLLFVAEFFMGAVFQVQIGGLASLIGGTSLAPISGLALGSVLPALYDFVILFGAVTVSPWFLVMMGTEMGALVVFRMRTVRELETRVRLGLVIVAYAVYSIFLPSFFLPSAELPKIPFLGWSMGVGTAGPVAPVLLVGLLGTYAVSGTLSFLFGGRQVCSMFCTAAMMYQGSFYDSMKTFNRSSAVGKKFLTSRLSSAYRAIFSIVWASLIGAIAISYLDSVGILNVTLYGSDPTQFLYTFYFGFLWYIVFILIPFVGVYGCVSMGWCHWGTFNQLVSRLGFFKLKVRDSDVCVKCETKDCAKACPVGLTDLPGSFIEKGEFKSMKCIGVGDCVSACPYSNEYFYDARHWLRRLLGIKEQPKFELKLMTSTFTAGNLILQEGNVDTTSNSAALAQSNTRRPRD
jgi:polyferredoxin